MNILDKIVERKRDEIQFNKSSVSIPELKQMKLFNSDTRSLKKTIKDPLKTGIIAEFKRKSPSKGWFTEISNPVKIIQGYDLCGASGISILTDHDFFGGSLEDLEKAKEIVTCPLLRKDFIMDSYQLVESRAWGADVILLIAAILTPEQVIDLAGMAKELSMEVLLEIHNEDELNHICEDVDFVGINNRNLKTFTVDINVSIRLGKLIPLKFIKISESGIDNTGTIASLKIHGFQGFLLGEHFMKENDPAMAFRKFTNELNYGV